MSNHISIQQPLFQRERRHKHSLKVVRNCMVEEDSKDLMTYAFQFAVLFLILLASTSISSVNYLTLSRDNLKFLSKNAGTYIFQSACFLQLITDGSNVKPFCCILENSCKINVWLSRENKTSPMFPTKISVVIFPQLQLMLQCLKNP